MSEVFLPDSVEAMLEKICRDQRQDKPDKYVRRRLAEVGEEESLKILTCISRSQIKRSLSAFIMFMINKSRDSSVVSSAGSVNNNSGSPFWTRSSPTSSSSSVTSPLTNGETSHSPFARHQMFTPSSNETRRCRLFDDMSSPVSNGQVGADSSHLSRLNDTRSPIFNEQVRAGSRDCSRFDDTRSPLSNEQIEGGSRNRLRFEETRSVVFNGQIGADSWDCSRFDKTRSPLFNEQIRADSRDCSRFGENPVSHEQIEADSRDCLRFDETRSPVFNGQMGADSRDCSRFDETRSPAFDEQIRADIRDCSRFGGTRSPVSNEPIGVDSMLCSRYEERRSPVSNEHIRADSRNCLRFGDTRSPVSYEQIGADSRDCSGVGDKGRPEFNKHIRADSEDCSRFVDTRSPVSYQHIGADSRVCSRFDDTRSPVFNEHIRADSRDSSRFGDTRSPVSNEPFGVDSRLCSRYGDTRSPVSKEQISRECLRFGDTRSPVSNEQIAADSRDCSRVGDKGGPVFNDHIRVDSRDCSRFGDMRSPVSYEQIGADSRVSSRFDDTRNPVFNEHSRADSRNCSRFGDTRSPVSNEPIGVDSRLCSRYEETRSPVSNEQIRADSRDYLRFGDIRSSVSYELIGADSRDCSRVGDKRSPEFNELIRADSRDCSRFSDTRSPVSYEQIGADSRVCSRFDDTRSPVFNEHIRADSRDCSRFGDTRSPVSYEKIGADSSDCSRVGVKRSPLFSEQIEANARDCSGLDDMASPVFNGQIGVDSRDCSNSGASECGNVANPQGVSHHLLDLDQLEFRKLFLILSYIGKLSDRKKLEEVITPAAVKSILKYKCSPMEIFESKIWELYGQKFCAESDRLQLVNWYSGKTHLYYCYIHPDGSRVFKGPHLNAAGTHLQRALGDENVMIVKLEQEGKYHPGSIKSIVEEGILVGCRRFRFFVYKDGGQEGKKKKSAGKDIFVKCYFVCTESLGPCSGRESYVLSGKMVHEARCHFMHVHMVNMAKYMARFSLILSKTVKLPVDLASVHVKEIEDIPCLDENGSIVYDEDKEPRILTDGTGYISADLAAKCPKNFYKEKHEKDVNYAAMNLDSLSAGLKSMEIGGGAQNFEVPLLMQCRVFHNGRAVKGTLLVNRMLPRSTIQIRPSMIKVKTDPSLSSLHSFNSLEIVAISQKPKRTLLSKTLIALLSYGGVPSGYFLDLLRSALEDAQSIFTNERIALKVAENYAERDDIGIARNMLWADIPLNEPYLRSCLSSMAKEERNGLKEGKIPIAESFYLMGTVDPTGTLRGDEVCIILDNGQISGKVLVYRNPGLHFGDIHVMTAVYVRALEDIVGNSKYAIFFSTKGQRSAASEIANGDFDGDRYWVCRHPQLLQYFRASKPWERIYSTPKSHHRKPEEYSPEELEYELFHQFLQARSPCYTMATAADSWLAFMDGLLTLGDENAEEKEAVKSKMLQLIDIYYDALDAPKTGKRVSIPATLKASQYPHFMGKKLSYHSDSILGQVYDTVTNLSENEKQPAPEIRKLACFDVEIPENCLCLWRERYNEYRHDMSEALKSHADQKNELANDVIKKYKELLYGAEEFDKSTRKAEDVYNEALSIYHVTYDYAVKWNDVKKCGFAWKVAGPALCHIYIRKQGETPLICSPSAIRKIL